MIRLVVIHAVVLAVVLAWMVANWHPGKSGIDVWLDPAQVVNGHVATGVVGEHLGSALLGGFVVVTTVVAAYLGFARGEDRRPG